MTYSPIVYFEFLLEYKSFSTVYSSKSDTPKQQSKKLKKLLKQQDKPKQKGRSGGFKLRKSLKEITNKHKTVKPKGENNSHLLPVRERLHCAGDIEMLFVQNYSNFQPAHLEVIHLCKA